MTEDNKTTHFGFENVPVAEKATRVKEVFKSVAPKYDLMNDAMSVGMHRIWTVSYTHLTLPTIYSV